MKRSGKKISLALPVSILENAQSEALRVYLISQIARAACIYRVNEIIILKDRESIDLINMFIKLLTYIETPQYLRKHLFPMSKELKLVGLMNPLDAPHHLRKDEWCAYREGVVLNKPVKQSQGSWVDVGFYKEIQVDIALKPGTRVTVQFEEDQEEVWKEQNNANERNWDWKQNQKNKNQQNGKRQFYHYKHLTATVVSPDEPSRNNYYWGYQVRCAQTFNEIFGQDQYDLVIGTSDQGDNFYKLKKKAEKWPPKYTNALIVFGGLHGIEEFIENDEGTSVNLGNFREKLFHYYLNVCPKQGTRTIRTEEAIIITMAALNLK